VCVCGAPQFSTTRRSVWSRFWRYRKNIVALKICSMAFDQTYLVSFLIGVVVLVLVYVSVAMRVSKKPKGKIN
jgi:hypothetical protein